jgi:hypothetical protein
MTASDSLRSAMWTRYHQPTDGYDEAFPFTGLERYAAFARDVVRRIDGDAGASLAGRAGYGRAGRSFTEPGGSR